MLTAKTGDTVRVHYTGRLDDGTVFDSSVGGEPLEFVIGANDVIRGFEEAVVGLAVGDRKTVSIAPEDAYGPWREENVFVVDRARLPGDVEPEVGMRLEGRTSMGVMSFVIAEVAGDRVVLDGNHPLAGQRLTFDLELVGLDSA